MRKYQKRCYAMVVTRGATKGEIKSTLEEKKKKEIKKKNEIYEHHFGISASFFGEQEWAKLLEG